MPQSLRRPLSLPKIMSDSEFTNPLLRERCEAALVKARLKPDGIKANFLKPFDKKPKVSNRV